MVTDLERAALVQQIGQQMSDLSEECYAAGWLSGWECILPHMYYFVPQADWTWGFWEQRADYSDELNAIGALVERAGTWAMMDLDGDCETFIAFDPRPFIFAGTLDEALKATDGFSEQLKGHLLTLINVKRDALRYMTTSRPDWFLEIEKQ